MKRCPACQGDISPDAKFCGLCGFRLGPIPLVNRRDRSVPAPDSEPVQTPRLDGGEQRRRCQRFPLKVNVDYRSAHNFFTGFAQNISSGGLFVATHTPAELGDDVEVTFTVPGLENACVARCTVVWVREHDAALPDMVPGMGLRFADLSVQVGDAIEAFIQHREPIFFEE